MFTKNDVFVKEVYSPPAGEKEIFLILTRYDETDTWSFDTRWKLSALKKSKYNGFEWKVYYNYSYELFTIDSSRFTVFNVVDFLNTPSQKRDELFHYFIKQAFEAKE